MSTHAHPVRVFNEMFMLSLTPMFQDYLGPHCPSFDSRGQWAEGQFFLPATDNDKVAQSCVDWHIWRLWNRHKLRWGSCFPLVLFSRRMLSHQFSSFHGYSSKCGQFIFLSLLFPLCCRNCFLFIGLFLYLSLELATFTLRSTSYLQSCSDMNESTLPSSGIVLRVLPGQWALPSFDPQCLAALLYLKLAIPGQFRVAKCHDLSPTTGRSFTSSFTTWRLIMDN